MKPRFRFSLNKSAIKAIEALVYKENPNLPKEKILDLFVESLIASAYSFFQPQDLLFRAIQQPDKTGYYALPIKLRKSEADYFIQMNKDAIYTYHNQALDLVFKEQLFRYSTGIGQYSTKTTS